MGARLLRFALPPRRMTGRCAPAYPWLMPTVGELVRCTDGRLGDWESRGVE